MILRRRALVCYTSSSNPKGWGLHHRVYALAWPVTSEALAELSDDLRSDAGAPVVFTSICWLEPEPAWWMQLWHWLRT